MRAPRPAALLPLLLQWSRPCVGARARPNVTPQHTDPYRHARAPLMAVDSSTASPPASISRAAIADTAPTTLPEGAATLGSLTLAMSTLCTLDRLAMSVAIIPMSAELGFGPAAKGAISAAFTVGYTLSLVPAGYLCARASTTGALAAGVALWSLFTIETPAAATASMTALLACRAAMGAAEGVTIPAIQTLTARWVPTALRSRALALVYTSLQLGTILALLTAPKLIEALGWPALFEVPPSRLRRLTDGLTSAQ